MADRDVLRNPSLHSTHRYHELVALTEVVKDGEERPYYIVTDYQGYLTWKRKALLELIEELQRTVADITDEELLEEEKQSLLIHFPGMFPQIYGEDDPLWLGYLSTHPELVKPPRPPRPPQPGYVYVVQCQDRFKIGCSKSPKGRIKAMSTKSPYPFALRMLLTTADMQETELELHRRFAAKRQRGEWFSLSPEDLSAIAEGYPTVDHSQLLID